MALFFAFILLAYWLKPMLNAVIIYAAFVCYMMLEPKSISVMDYTFFYGVNFR